MKQGIFRAAFAAAFVAAFAGSAPAQTYPERPIRLIVGYAPGGSVDIVARIITDKLAQRLGQRFVVDNRPGGGTIIASQLLAKSAPDGYTLMLADIAHGANPALNEALPYNTEKDFMPVVQVAFFPAVLAVEKSLPVHNLQEFVAYAKEKDGQLNYSSSGVGSMNYLATELLKKQTGLNIVHVPYQSGAQATTALLGGFVQMLITTVPPIVGYSQKLNLLAVSRDKRMQALPDVPTFAEAGMPNFKVQLWQGLLAPAGTDRTIVDKLNMEFNDVLKMPDVQARLVDLGGDVAGGTPEAFGSFIHAEIARWKEVIPPEARIKR
jgi:tripartite-type tricarboxylate transporter receptor subunit TctC